MNRPIDNAFINAYRHDLDVVDAETDLARSSYRPRRVTLKQGFLASILGGQDWYVDGDQAELPEPLEAPKSKGGPASEVATSVLRPKTPIGKASTARANTAAVNPAAVQAARVPELQPQSWYQESPLLAAMPAVQVDLHPIIEPKTTWEARPSRGTVAPIMAIATPARDDALLEASPNQPRGANSKSASWTRAAASAPSDEVDEPSPAILPLPNPRGDKARSKTHSLAAVERPSTERQGLGDKVIDRQQDFRIVDPVVDPNGNPNGDPNGDPNGESDDDLAAKFLGAAGGLAQTPDIAGLNNICSDDSCFDEYRVDDAPQDLHEQPSEKQIYAPRVDPAQKLPPAPFHPEWEVDRFHWPEVCEKLRTSRGDALREAGEQLTGAAAGGLSALLVTSACRGEGRTTLAACLARAAAEAGSRVVLVDADLDHPSMAEQLNICLQHDWREAVFEGERLENAAVLSIADRLTLVPLRTDYRRIGQSLADRRVGTMLRHLASEFDLVVIDAGPLSLAEKLLAGAAAPIIDAVIVARDQRSTTDEEVDRCIDAIRLLGVESVGIAENFGQSKAG